MAVSSGSRWGRARCLHSTVRALLSFTLLLDATAQRWPRGGPRTWASVVPLDSSPWRLVRFDDRQDSAGLPDIHRRASDQAIVIVRHPPFRRQAVPNTVFAEQVLPDTHQSAKGWPEHCAWNPFTIKTLLELARPRMGASSGVHVTPEHGCLELHHNASLRSLSARYRGRPHGTIEPGTVPSARRRCTTGLGLSARALTRLIPDLFLPLQILIDVILVAQVVRNGSVDFLQAQGGIELLDELRGVAFLESDHDRVQRNV